MSRTLRWTQWTVVALAVLLLFWVAASVGGWSPDLRRLTTNVHGPLLAILNFFSIFQIWYLVVLTFGLAYLTKSTKGKAFAAITPAWLVPLFLRIVQSMFQGTNT